MMHIFKIIGLAVIGAISLIAGIFNGHNQVLSIQSPTQEYATLSHYGMQNNPYFIGKYNLNNYRKFGANPGSLPNVLANFTDSLAVGMSTTDSTATLVSGLDVLSRVIRGKFCFTIDAQTATSEFTCGNATGTAVTQLTRGVDPLNWNTTSSAAIFAHRRGSPVTITDYTSLGAITRLLNGSDTLANILQYDVVAPTSTIGNNIYNLAHVGYVNGVASSGAANASPGVKGIVDIATAAQVASGTGTGIANATLVPPNSQFSATTSAANIVPVVGLSGFLSSAFINTSTPYTWSSTTTFASSTQFNATATLSANLVGGAFIPTLAFSSVSSTLSFSTNSGSFTVIGTSTANGIASTTITLIGAHRVLLTFSGTLQNYTANSSSSLNMSIDGTNITAQANGLMSVTTPNATGLGNQNASFSYVTDALTAAAHTFRVLVRTQSGIVNVQGGTLVDDSIWKFSAQEIYN